MYIKTENTFRFLSHRFSSDPGHGTKDFICNRRPLDPPTASPNLPKSLDADTSNCRGWLTGEKCNWGRSGPSTIKFLP